MNAALFVLGVFLVLPESAPPVPATSASSTTADADAIWRHRTPDDVLDAHANLSTTLFGLQDPIVAAPSPSSFSWGQAFKGRAGLDAFWNRELRFSLEGEALVHHRAGVFDQSLPDSFRVRSAFVEWRSPLGAFFIGRMPLHYGLGLISNSAEEPDSLWGDRVDQMAWVAPLVGHVWSLSFSWAQALATPLALNARPFAFSDKTPTVTLGVAKRRSPRVRALLQRDGILFWDYGLRLSGYGQSSESRSVYDAAAGALGLATTGAFSADQRGVLLGLNAQNRWGGAGMDAEVFGGLSHIENVTPQPNLRSRQVLNPTSWGGLIRLGHLPAEDRLVAFGELGAGSQIHPSHLVDLFLWRTLLGRVSDAAYVRGHAGWQALSNLRLDFNAIHSRSLAGAPITQGGAGLGTEADLGVTLSFGALAFHAQWGGLAPLPGLGSADHTLPPLVHMGFFRMSHAL
jgi:hypothetical protein